MLFILTHVLAILVLLLSIFGATSVYQIAVNMDWFLTLGIGLMFIVAAVRLSFLSLPYFLFFGGITAALTLCANVIGQTKPLNGILAVVFSFIFWPEAICFIIFAIQHIEKYRENEHK